MPLRRGKVRRNEAPSFGLAPNLKPAIVQGGCLPTKLPSPSPVPPVVRFRAGSARQNRSKTRSTSARDIPTPSSVTVTATADSLAPTATWMGLPSPCSIAFAKRLRRSLSIRRPSISASTGPCGNIDAESLNPCSLPKVQCRRLPCRQRHLDLASQDRRLPRTGVITRNFEKVVEQSFESVRFDRASAQPSALPAARGSLDRQKSCHPPT